MENEWNAVKALNGALEKTKQLLFKKFNLGFWLKLGLVVFILGESNSFNPSSGFQKDSKDFTADIAKYLPIIVTIIAVILVIGLVLAFIRAVCQFIFIEALAGGSIEIWRGFKRNLDSGLNLFLFNLGLSLVAVILLLAIIVPPAYFIYTEGFEKISNFKLLIILVVGFLLIMGVAVILGLIGSFTNEFVTIIMYKKKTGVIEGWKQLYGLLRNNLKQFIVYILIRMAIGIIAAIATGVIGFAIAFVAAILIIAVGLGIAFALYSLSGSTDILIMLLIPAIAIAIIYFLVIAYFIVVITLPVPVFFRYYSILFIQYVEPTLDVIKETPKKKEVENKPEKRLKVY